MIEKFFVVTNIHWISSSQSDIVKFCCHPRTLYLITELLVPIYLKWDLFCTAQLWL